MVVSLRFKETGSVTTYQPHGRKGKRLSAVGDGGAIVVFNTTGDPAYSGGTYAPLVYYR